MSNHLPKPIIVVTLGDPAGTVNTSLGIPIVRTSVDHGTAVDIEGNNSASEGKMVAAMNMAATVATHKLQSASRTHATA